MKRDFSIRKEIEVELKENLDGLNINVDNILDNVENDEFLLNVITLSIYESIAENLSEEGRADDTVDSKLLILKSEIVRALMDKGII